jgi:hypothetical protein
MKLEWLKKAHPEAKSVELWAQDEARLGLKPVIRRGWAPVGETHGLLREGATSGPTSTASLGPRAGRFSG